MDPKTGASGAGDPPQHATAVLLERARRGDSSAGELLFARCMPALRRWAHHRLPARLRGLGDTDDLVQETLLRAFRNLDTFEHRGEGAFLAYLRSILLNAVRDGMRRAEHRQRTLALTDAMVDTGPSVVEQAIGADQLERFERAVARLPEAQQQAVILRVEFGYSYAQIAEALGRPSVDSTRMLVSRALARVADLLRDE